MTAFMIFPVIALVGIIVAHVSSFVGQIKHSN
jgi:hypothetical protein